MSLFPISRRKQAIANQSVPRFDEPKDPLATADVAESAKIALLTEREREVITLVGEGLRNKHIAARLSISIITVRHHLCSIFSKLGVGDRFELAFYAYRHGLAKPPF